MMQLPALTPVTTLPFTVQMLEVGELSDTRRFELAVALKMPVVPTAITGTAPKEIV
jgi:hypothetical protein